ncbi:Csu type fimbrial protein [Dyella soli]|uniref:Spore coat U domain-containing protein n=1 Tax=Dyella soli TaxID=522319 RepID=A0A4R0YLJ8_9GAMM|nr:spore coat protein U domain-containing protein [Dyella soli]TCI06483.1 spore coat U domain-containing protein [Dyella soli]
MATTIPRLCLLLLLLFAAGMLGPGTAHAANVVCSTNGTPTVNFGSSSTAQGSIGYICTNYTTSPVSFTLCAGIGTPSYPGTPAQPLMQGNGATLAFNLYTNPSNTQVWTTANPLTTPVTVGGGIGTPISGTIPVYGSLSSNQSAPAGVYNASFFNTVLGQLVGGTCLAVPNNGIVSGLDFTLTVQANVVSACVVSASPTLSLGTVPATATNLSGTTTLQVTCPTNTSYYVGLRPSNNSTTGAGVMRGTGTNTDTVSYQLHSGSATGPIWGNTATSTSAGNGVAGVGTGNVQTINVYAATFSADVTADTYTDVVTVSVNY